MIKKIFFTVTVFFLMVIVMMNETFKEVAAGVAILILGMMMLEDGFNTYVEGPVQKFINRVTDTLPKSMGVGFIFTTLLQSSSLISVITISFLSAGLMGLRSGIGIIFGANLGSTTTAWLVSLFGLDVNISALSMPILILGVIFISQKSKNIKGIGNILMGLGFFFLGIHFMKIGFEVYRDQINLAAYAIPGFLGLVVFTFIGIIVTVVIQSSGAAMALILTALAAGQITYSNSLALAIGANIGTTITAILGALNANAAGKQLAAAHLVFNFVTGLIAITLIAPLGSLVNYLSSLLNVASDNYTIKLSIFHSLFNVIGVLVMVPFINPMVKGLKRMFKEKKRFDTDIDTPVFINNTIMAHSQTALKALRDESKRLFENAAFEIITHGLNLHRADIKSTKKLKQVVNDSVDEIEMDIDEMYYRKVKTIYSTIIEYTTLALSRFSLSRKEVEAFSRIKVANRDIVVAIKNLRGLRKNVNQYTRSDNQYIREEYNLLRRKVSKLLRFIYKLTQDPQSQKTLRSLEKIKAKVEKSDILIDGRIDQLIREQHISSTMATSLINDSEIVVDIIEGLVEAAELLYIDEDKLLDENNPTEVTSLMGA